MLVLSRIRLQKAGGKRAKNFLFSPNRNGTENGIKNAEDRQNKKKVRKTEEILDFPDSISKFSCRKQSTSASRSQDTDGVCTAKIRKLIRQRGVGDQRDDI